MDLDHQGTNQNTAPEPGAPNPVVARLEAAIAEGLLGEPGPELDHIQRNIRESAGTVDGPAKIVLDIAMYALVAQLEGKPGLKAEMINAENTGRVHLLTNLRPIASSIPGNNGMQVSRYIESRIAKLKVEPPAHPDDVTRHEFHKTFCAYGQKFEAQDIIDLLSKATFQQSLELVPVFEYLNEVLATTDNESH